MPNLHVLELEDRRVLSGLPAAYLSAARELVLSAGSRANDGQDDTFLVRRQGEDLHVSVNGQDVYDGRLADVAKIRVEGSSDRDILLVDYSGGDPLPVEGAGFNAGMGSSDSADALVLVGGTIASPLDTVTHQFQGLGAGSVRVSLGDAAGQTTSSLSYTGVESIRDATQTQHLVFQDNRAGEVLTLTGGDPGNGPTQIVSSHGPQVAFDAPSQSLTIAGAAIDVQGRFRGAHATVDLRAQGDLWVSGTIDVSDSAAGRRGGTIVLSADRIELADGARLDASGAAGGGTVLVGGGFRGLDASVRNASTTHVDANASIRADALGAGDGGAVVIWADDRTSFDGTISARGGPTDGQGGLAEVSGKRWLEFQGLVYLSAASGTSGTLLLDPTTIVIDSAYAATLVAQLEVGNVSLLADEIIVQSAVDASGNSTIGTSLQLHASTITLSNGANLITNEGELVLDGEVVLDTGASVLLSTGLGPGGNLSVLGTIDGGGSDLTIEAGSGDIVLGGTVDGVRSLVLNSSGTTYLKGAVGSSVAVGSLTTDSGGATHVSANVTTQGGTQIYDDPVVLTNHVTFTDTGTTGIFFNSTVEGDANGPWNLTVVTTEVLSEIQFNDAVGSGHLIGNVTILNAGRLEIGPDADMTVEGAFAQVGLGPVRSAGDITTSGGGVSFSSAVTLTGDVSIDTGAGLGDILFQNVVNGVGLETLTLLAGGNISFTGAIGAITPLAAITILDAHDVTIQGPIAAASLIQVTGSGTTTLRGNVTTNNVEGLDLTTGNVVLDGLTITATGDGIVRLNAAVDLTGDVTIAAQAGIRFEGTVDSSGGGAKSLALWTLTDVAFLDAVGSATAGALGAITILFAENVEAASTIAAASFVELVGMGTTTLSGDITTGTAAGVNLNAASILLNELTITTTGGGIVRFNAPVDLNGDVTIDAEGTITFESTLASPGLDARSLTLGSDADILFRDSVGGGPGNSLGAITITTATDVRADSTITAASLVLVAVSGTATLTGDVTTSALEGIDLSAGTILLDGLSMIATGDGIVRLNGPVILGGDVTIEAADGGIVFTALATIDGQIGESNDLLLSAGSGSVSFNADIGATQRIGSLVVTQADGGVTFGGSDGPDAGPVSLVRTEGIINIGSVAAITDGIALNAGDGNTISFITAGGSVRLSGLVELQSDASIDTSDGGNVPGADIRFTRHALIDSQDGENNGLTLTAGLDGTVSFNADIGSVTGLEHLIVTSAFGVAFGNDASQADADLAPIAVVRIDGAPLDPTVFSIDIGSVAAIGEGGIRLNAGEAGTLTFTTTGDRVRLNGAVELQSHVAIDTSDGGSETGAEIRFTRHAAIDSQAGEGNDLILTAGAEGTVSFNADIGATTGLGQLIVTDAMGVAFGNDADPAEPDFSPLSTIRVIGHLAPLDADAFAVNIGSVTAIGENGIKLNAGNDSTLSLVTTGDKVRLNGAVELQSHVAIDTSDAGGSGGAEIRFTANALLDSEPGESNGLTLAAGVNGTVSFNADIGATAALAYLIVTDAKGVAFGNDLDQTDPDLAPVTTIWIDGDAPEPDGFAFDIGSVTAIGPDGISLNGGDGGLISLFTTADKVRLNGAVQLHSDALIDTSGNGIAIEGADILFEGTIDGTAGGLAENLSLVSHSGTIVVSGAVGSAVPLGTISLQNDLPESTGAVLFFGAVYAAWLETFSQQYDVELLGGGFIVDAVEFLNTGGVTLGDGVDDDLTFGHGVTSTASHTSVGGTIRTLALDMQFATVSVIADARLLTAGGNIGFAGSVDSMAGEHFDLELTALSGIVQFSADVGSTAPLNHLVVHSAGSIELGSDASPVHTVMAVGGIDLGRTSAIGDILLNGGVGGLLALGTAGGMVRLNGRVELQSDVSINSADGGEPAGAEIRFTSNSTIDSEAGETNRLILTAGTDGTVSFNADIGAVDALKQLIVTEAKAVAFGNDASAADLDLASVSTVRVDGDPLDPDAFAINIGSVTAIGGEAITLNAGDGNTIWFITTGDRVRFNGALELYSDARIDTSDVGNEAGAEIRFTLNAPIDSQLGESNGLTLTAGVEGTVSFNGDIGTREAPGHLIVTDAKGVVFGGEQSPDFAPLTTVRVGGDALDPDFFFLDLGSVTAIGDGGIVLNGGHDLAGNPLTLTVASASGAMRFNGAVSLWSDVLVDTADADASFGAQIRFTQYAPIDSQAGEHNDLILTAGEGNVEFNANLGEQQTLDRFEITRADAGVVFGASDEAEAGGDRAPVRIINADGGIDIGSLEVITGGIVLNAGADFGDVQVITLATAGTDVRMNGPVTLASHVAVDTGAGAGDILFTDDSPIDSESAEKNDLVLTANAGRILFNADLGAQQALHWLEVTQADGGVYFGGADVAQDALGDLGPVRQVVVEAGLNLGSQSVISGGIFFNAGELGEILVLVETGDDDPATSDARLNGSVWLWSDLAIDTSGGIAGIGITFTADTTIDSQAGEHNSLRLNAGPGDVRFYTDIGTTLDSDLDSRIGRLDVESSSNVWVADTVLQINAFGDIDFVSSGNVAIGYAPAEDEVTGDPPQPDLDPPVVETTVTGHTITIRAKGNLTIVDGAALQSHTGMVSNAPPIFRPAPNDPNKVLVPGDRVHVITGTMGGNQTLDGGSKDNWERGVNFTLSLFWGDLKTTIVRNIQAGDVIDLEVGEDGEIIKLDITHKEDEATGVITYTLRRHYSLAYLQTVETTVETLMVMSNDENIRLDDARTVNLNETSAVRGIKVASDLLRPSEPIPEYLSPPPLRPSESAVAVFETSTIPVETRATRYDEARPSSEEGAETLRVWYLVRVLPNGKEDTRHPLSEDVASDPVKLFQSLREMGLPDGRYRIYLEELGFPRRMVYEFYKSGNSLGDPVRERGPGSNPVPQARPESDAPMDKQGVSEGPAQNEAAAVADPFGSSAASILIVCPEMETDVLRFVVAGDRGDGSPAAGLDGKHERLAGSGSETSGAPLGAVVALGSWLCGTLAAGPQRQDALASPASDDWSARRGRHDWNERVDEALEKCPQRALTRGARLQRRLECRS